MFSAICPAICNVFVPLKTRYLYHEKHYGFLLLLPRSGAPTNCRRNLTRAGRCPPRARFYQAQMGQCQRHRLTSAHPVGTRTQFPTVVRPWAGASLKWAGRGSVQLRGGSG